MSLLAVYENTHSGPKLQARKLNRLNPIWPWHLFLACAFTRPVGRVLWPGIASLHHRTRRLLILCAVRMHVIRHVPMQVTTEPPGLRK